MQVFDAGETFTMYKVREVFSDDEYEEELNEGQAEEEEIFNWHVAVSGDGAVDTDDAQQLVYIYIYTYCIPFTDPCNSLDGIENRTELNYGVKIAVVEESFSVG